MVSMSSTTANTATKDAADDSDADVAKDESKNKKKNDDEPSSLSTKKNFSHTINAVTNSIDNRNRCRCCSRNNNSKAQIPQSHQLGGAKNRNVR
mmetsp:Transcript_14850/g.31770  ORF Transcript_14850/g.31770 Transcript_14850/m.31770 type:complete len:94 (+) Transcript_14850:99-380(+)